MVITNWMEIPRSSATATTSTSSYSSSSSPSSLPTPTSSSFPHAKTPRVPSATSDRRCQSSINRGLDARTGRPALNRVSSIRYSVRPFDLKLDLTRTDDADSLFSLSPPSPDSGTSHATHFANVEDMLFEVFRCEETDSIDSIAIAHFLKVGRSLHLRPICITVRDKHYIRYVRRWRTPVFVDLIPG